MTLTYDAFGRMAEQNRSGAYTQFVYSPTGFEMQIMNGQSSIKSIVALPAGNAVVYTAAGQFNYYSDHLGSFRFASTTSRTMYFDLAYAPFGETYATSGSTDPAFTGQRQDTVSGLYDFPAREYSIQGRWPSPDPAGLAAVDPTNPQSWNRYAYALNNPLNSIDPSGMACAGLTYTTHNCNGFAGNNGSFGANWSEFGILQIAFTPTGNIPNPDWWTTGCIEAFDCGNIPAFLPVYGNWGALSLINLVGQLPPNIPDPGHDPLSNAYRRAPQQPPCYGSNSLADKAVRTFSLFRLPETWKEWVLGGTAKIGVFEVAKAGARSAGGAESLGASSIATTGKFLGLAGTVATVGATMVDASCQIGGTIEPVPH